MLLLLPAAFATGRYPLLGNSTDLTDLGKLAAYGVAELVIFLVGLAASIAGYLGAVYSLRGRRFGDVARPVLAVSGLLLVAYGLLYPVTAIDLFIYAARSHLLTEYGADPSAVPPGAYWDVDPYVRFASAQWAESVSPYGPLWNLVAAPATLLDGDRILPAMLIFKLLAVAAAAATAYLIHDIVRPERPREALAAAVAFLWNPLLLWEGIGNGHNDVVVMLPVVAALWSLHRRHDSWVIPLLVASALLKYVTLLLLPFALVALWRRHRSPARRVRLATQSALASMLLVYIALYPYFDLAALQNAAAGQSGIFLTSPGSAALLIANAAGVPFDIAAGVRLAGAATFACTLISLLALQARGRLGLTRTMFEAMFALLLVATWNFRPWYLIWLVALAALLPFGWPLWRTVTWTTSALLAYAHFIWLREWWPSTALAFNLTGISILFVPVVVATLAELAILASKPIGPLEPRPPGR